MTRNQGLALCQRYASELPPHVTPMEDATGTSWNHIRWMLEQMLVESDDWPDDKFWRWMGYIQCMLVYCGFRTLERLREESRE